MIAILLIILLATLIYIISHYNQLQKLAKHVRLANFALIDSYQQRIELLNQLINLVSAFDEDKSLTTIPTLKDQTSQQEFITRNKETAALTEQLLLKANQYPQLEINPLYQQGLDKLSDMEGIIYHNQEKYIL
jgi:hypothetical protein